MIGLLANIDQVVLYENAEKIITVSSSIISALETVMLPRMSNMYGIGKHEATEKLIEKSVEAMILMCFAMVWLNGS